MTLCYAHKFVHYSVIINEIPSYSKGEQIWRPIMRKFADRDHGTLSPIREVSTKSLSELRKFCKKEGRKSMRSTGDKGCQGIKVL